MRKSKKNETTEEEHYCRECANVTPVTDFHTLSVNGKEPTLGKCPHWTNSKSVLLSQKACNEFDSNNNIMAEKKTENKKIEVNELVYIQSNLKAPKNQFNSYGGYKYRSCEDIMEAVKPLLKETDCSLTVSDEIVQIGDRFYVKATATLRTSSGETYQNTAFAREALTKKGMDESQVTGTASSYARKYALNGLFCIDDTKDADALNTNKEYTQPQATSQPQAGEIPQEVLNEINSSSTTDQLSAIYGKYAVYQKDARFTGALTARKDQILKNGKS